MDEHRLHGNGRDAAAHQPLHGLPGKGGLPLCKQQRAQHKLVPVKISIAALRGLVIQKSHVCHAAGKAATPRHAAHAAQRRMAQHRPQAQHGNAPFAGSFSCIVPRGRHTEKAQNLWQPRCAGPRRAYGARKRPGGKFPPGHALRSPGRVQRAFVRISSRICASNSSSRFTPPFSSLRARTETVPSSISFAPTTSI